MTQLDVLSPVPGRVIELAEVPDPVFAQALVGPGLAVDPVRTGPVTAVAPVAGRLVKLHPHAFVLQTDDGAGVLTHLGIDTVQLAGEGFELHVAEGDVVAAGDAVVTWDPAAVATSGRSPVVPVIALEATPSDLDGLRPAGPAEAGDVLFTWAR
ncbi:PTS sugar transporter subunit IIA [Jiangella aurantiaca]|uniref:PTS sugar transporter subunit IIA n=1 Tax=Jiangella aurantiaca TaxID=2530373 RepID=UPI001EF10676|nr:PTS glucose transporter subunit IIA [Jiangella aurantiaca]